MKIIALDSTGLVASVAVWEDGTVLAEYSTNFKKTHSETLLPMLQELRENLELDLETVDAIAISNGPGSFTGLRIGSATAKGLGMAMDIPVIEVPTLSSLAWNLWGTDKLVCPMMDARRKQVYTAAYEFGLTDITEGQMNEVIGQSAMLVTDLIQQLNTIGREVIFLGDGVPVYAEDLQQGLSVRYSFAPSHLNRQRAGSVADLAAVYMKQGKVVSADDHAPEYLRKSQAENEGPQKFEI